MWYNSRPMVRRALTLTFFAVLVLQLAGGMALASACFEPCPEDSEQSSCPPTCAVCTTCTHAQPAIVQQTGVAETLGRACEPMLHARSAVPTQFADDIFHVPLRG